MKKFYKVLLAAATIMVIVAAHGGKWDSAFAGDTCDPMKKALEYGIYCENLTVRQASVQSGDNLEKIFLNEGFSYSTINDVIRESRPVFDARRMRIGDSYSVFTPKYMDETPRYLVYDRNAVEYVVFDLEDPVKVYKKERPVEIRLRTVEAPIDPSLWSAFQKENLDFRLALQLSEIYAWTLDFYHFQKGDSFKIFFEEKWVNNKKIGNGKIKAACMTYDGKEHYAIYFQQKEKRRGDYYDDKGYSLKKSFLKAPLKYTSITSGYSGKRLHPILKQYRPHPGIDYAAPKGTPVMSVGDGIVEKTKYSRSAGNYIQIRHSDTYKTQYMHLSKFAKNIKPGAEVSQGQTIGYVGRTGLATGPHLDFRFWVNGKTVNYLRKDIPKTEPIKKKHRARFNALVSKMKSELNISEARKFSAEADHPSDG